MHASQFVMSRSALAGVQAVAARSGRAFARHTHDQYGIGRCVEETVSLV